MCTPTADDALEPLLSAPAVAHVLGTTPEALATLRWRGQGPSWCRIGRRVMYRPAAIREWIARRTEGGVEPEVLEIVKGREVR